MSAPAQCPLCGTKLLPDWESCPNCPMSFLDAPPEETALQSDAFRGVFLPVLFFCGLAYFIWTFSHYLWRTAEEGMKPAQPVATSTGTPPLSSKGAGVVPRDRDDDQQRSPDGQGPGSLSSMPERQPKAKIVAEWKMRGAIYDLITLKPVPGVHMIFTDNVTNSRAQIQTDAQGRYRVILPPLPGRGYLVSLSKTGYGKAYLDPGTEGVAEMPLARRNEIAKELSSLIAEPASLQPNADNPLVTDFHMAPK